MFPGGLGGALLAKNQQLGLLSRTTIAQNRQPRPCRLLAPVVLLLGYPLPMRRPGKPFSVWGDVVD